MFKYRIISFPLLIALAAVIFIFPAVGCWIYLILATAALGLASFEAAAMLNNSAALKCHPKTVGAAAAFFTFFSLLPSCHPFLSGMYGVSLAFLPLLLLLMPVYFLLNKSELERVLGSAGILFVIFFPLLCAVNLWHLKINVTGVEKFNVPAVLFLIAVSKSMDTGGYIFGMLSSKLPGGNHKIAPSVSPKKSWEGFFGGLILTVIAALMFHWLGNVKILFCIVSGVVLGIGSFFGDLTESALKRRCNIKDSGNYIPGMGGALDVLDSFIYNGILLAFLIGIYNFF